MKTILRSSGTFVFILCIARLRHFHPETLAEPLRHSRDHLCDKLYSGEGFLASYDIAPCGVPSASADALRWYGKGIRDEGANEGA